MSETGGMPFHYGGIYFLSLPMRGNLSEVGGILSPITMRNTVIERSVVIPRVTWKIIEC